MSISGSIFVCFVCFVVQSPLPLRGSDSFIRVHSCPFVVQSPLPLRGFEGFIRAHSCPFVVLSFFRVFRVFRGSIPPCPFVVLKDLFVPIRVHSWFCFFRVFRVFRGSTPLAPGHDYDDYLSVCLKNAGGAASWGGRSGEYSPLPSAPSTLHP